MLSVRLIISHISIFLLLLCTTGYAQVERYSYHDTERKQIKEIYHVQDTISNILEGKYLSYHINGKIESKGEFSGNETVGLWEFYYETGSLKMRGMLKKNSSDGFWEYFFENGNKSMQGEITNKKRRGEWEIYYESGDLKEKGTFQGNKREGLWKHYFEDGTLKGEINYTYDKGRYTEYYRTGEKSAEGPKSASVNVGLWKHYYKDGQVQAEGSYENGKRSGFWRYYHLNGEVAARGEFNNGNPNGEWIYFYEDGKVSSKGQFQEGKKSGYWGLFYNDGSLKGEVNFDNGNGLYQEFYKSGAKRIEGPIVDGKNQGLWKYYYENGDLEGECEFERGVGEYFGYYPDGTLQTKGTIDDGKKVGKWELYKNDGTLSGYYKPIYSVPTIPDGDFSRTSENIKYGVGEFKFKSKKFNYFDSKLNEFKGVIVGFNPLFAFIGRVPVGIEFYTQERLGHEFEFEGVRDPFFTNDNDVPLNDIYSRGYSMAIKQKLYNPKGEFGMWYFGHELRFTNLSHFANVSDSQPSGNVFRRSASEQKFEYSLLLGYRIMQDTRAKGFTIDVFGSVGTGYRNFKTDESFETLFDDLNQSKIPLALNFGINFGYTFASKGRR